MWLSLTAVVGQLGLAMLLAAFAVIVFAVLADVVAEGQTRAFDLAVIQYFQTHQPAWMHQPVLDITWLANGQTIAVVLSSAVIALVAMRRVWPDAGILALVGLGGFGFVEGVKAIYHRPRPSIAVDLGYSFPSGHSFLSMSVYGMLAYYLSLNLEPRARKWIWGAAGLIILLIGSSRVLLGAHYPSDVLAGFASGGAWLWSCLALRRLFRRRDWGAWKSQRLSRLVAARSIVDGLSDDRELLKSFGQKLSEDRAVNSVSRAFAKSGLVLQSGYVRLSSWWPALRSHSYDLVVLAAPLRAAAKRLKDSECLRYERDLEAVKKPLRQLWTAQRGLFGIETDEPYVAAGESAPAS